MKMTDFYIYNFNIINSNEDIDLSKIPLSIKRRCSNIDKTALSLFSKTYSNEVEEIVFASIHGEFERLNSIIAEYQTYNEVSPMQFSGSVHNFPAGCFCLIQKLNIPYHAISSDNNSISAGLIKSLISDNDKVLFCYADSVDEIKGVSCIISKEKPIDADAIKCEFIQNYEKIENDEFTDFCNFLKGITNTFNSSLCKFERVK